MLNQLSWFVCALCSCLVITQSHFWHSLSCGDPRNQNLTTCTTKQSNYTRDAQIRSDTAWPALIRSCLTPLQDEAPALQDCLHVSRNVELAEVLATPVLLTPSVKRLQFLQHVIQRVNCCLQPAKSRSSGAGNFPGIKYSEYVNLYYPYPQNAGAIFNLHATCMYVMGPQITLHADKT